MAAKEEPFLDIAGCFELDGRVVHFTISGIGPEDYDVTTSGVERHARACQRVEDVQRVLAGEAFAVLINPGSGD